MTETPSLKGGLTFGITNGPYDGRDERRAKRDKTNVDLYGEGLLGGHLAPEKGGALAEKFMVPPFSVLNAREGFWQERKRAWLSLGIQSELGRGGDSDSPQVTEQGYRKKEANKAAPGGAAMPAMNYKDRERGTGSGAPIAGTGASPVPKASEMPHKRFSIPTITTTTQPEPKKQATRPVFVAPSPLSLPAAVWLPPTELPRLTGAKRVSVDVETRDEHLVDLGPGVRRPDCYIVGLAIGRDDGSKWYLPMRHEGGDNLDADLVLRWAKEELNSFDGELVGANLNYDLDFLAHEGITFPKVRRFRDIQIAEPLLDEHRLTYSLDALAKDYLGQGKDEALLADAARAYGFGSSAKDIKTNLWRLPARFVGAYAEADADLPLRILPLQEARLASEDLTELFDLESRLSPVLLAMRRRGVRVDLDKAERVRDVLTKERDKWLKIVRSYAGPSAELMAPDSLAGALRQRGLHVPITAKKGKPSIKKEFFEQNKGDPLVDAIAAGRRCSTLLSTFVEGHILGHHINGRIYATFNQLRSDDGGTIARLSSSNPNLQNVPSRKNDLDEDMALGEDVVKLIRGIFIPEEGEHWERHDLSQIEYRYLTHFAVGAGADEARALYNTDPNTDFHKLCAAFIHVDPNDKPGRKKVKGVNFSKVYGGGAKTIAKNIGCTEEEAKEFIALYDGKLPFVKETLEKAAFWANKRGYVTTILGRRGRFPLWVPNGYNDDRPPKPHDAAVAAYGPNIKRYMTYAALSRKLQGSAADHIKKAMVDIKDAGIMDVLGALLISVHDENDWSVPQTPAGLEAAAEARNILANCIKLNVPVYADADRGADWGVCS